MLLFATISHPGQGWIPNNTLCHLTVPYPQLLSKHHILRTQFGYLKGMELSLASSQNYFLFTGKIELYYSQGFSCKTTSFPAFPYLASVFVFLQTSCVHLKIHYQKKVSVRVEVTQSCPTVCDPMDYTVHGILQTRILEWVAYPFSSGSSPPRNPTGVSWFSYNISHIHFLGESLILFPINYFLFLSLAWWLRLWFLV